MNNNLTREELIAIGVNPDNMTYFCGEMNIIVQCFGSEDGTTYDEKTGSRIPMTKVYPDIYHPRKSSVWSCGCEDDPISIESEEDKEDYVEHLRDSAERLKIMAYYLSCQADEIEKFGYPKTNCYYPE
jgi:hypothetical protein